jgi:hypothetical protein
MANLRSRLQLLAPESFGSEAVYLLVGIVVLGLAWSRLASGGVSLLVWQDASEQTYAWWQYSVSELQSGRLPLWDPYTMGGRSHIGEGQEGVFYPPFLLLALTTGQWAASIAAIHLFAFLHAVIGLATAYVLARVLGLRGLASLGCGLVYALGSFFSFRAMEQLNIFDSTAWVPLAVSGPFLVARTGRVRWALVSAGALALSLLAGHAQPPLHAAMIIVMALVYLCCFRVWADVPRLQVPKAGLALALMGASAACLSAVQILPMLEYEPLALRWVGAPDPVVANARVPFDVIATNPSLDIHALPAALYNSTVTIADGGLYIGYAALICVAIGAALHTGRIRFFWLGVMILGIGLALGVSTPLLGLAYVFPLVDKIREPVRYLLLAHVSLAVMVGFGLDYLTRIGRVAFAVGLLVVASLELGLAWSSILPLRVGYNATTNREVQQYFSSPEADGVARFLADQPGLFRIDLTDSPLPRNYGELLRIPTVGGYRATSPLRIQRFRETLGWLPPDPGPDILGTRFLVSSQPLPGVNQVGQAGSVKIYENPRALAPAWLVSDARLASDDAGALDAIAAPGFDAARVAVVTGNSLPSLGPAAGGSAAITEYLPSTVRITTQSSGAALLVTSQPEFPGWVATIDGRSTDILNLDYAFIGVAVPEGRHNVEFDYRPLSVYAGGAITLVTLLTICALVTAGKRLTSTQTLRLRVAQFHNSDAGVDA